MGNRYDDRIVLRNKDAVYRKVFKKRNVHFIRHFDTAVIHMPTINELENIKAVQHIWTTGDRFYKLAAKHYNLPSYWWVIAQYNKKPTEAHVKLGDPLWIPLPLSAILSYLR